MISVIVRPGGWSRVVIAKSWVVTELPIRSGKTGAQGQAGLRHEHLSKIEWRIAARKGALKTMTDHDRAIESRKAAVRAKVEHPFLIVKRDFAFTKTRYRGIAKNLNHLQMLFASANWLMRARAVALTQATA